MDNLSKIKKFSVSFHSITTLLIVAIPLYYTIYWSLINHIPATLITVNAASLPLSPNTLPIYLQLMGFIASLLPSSALLYGLVNVRRLFAFYKKGVIFSLKHVGIFKNISKALLLWVLFSMLYESAKSVLFSLGNPPGSRVLELSFSSVELGTLIIGGFAYVVSWVMDEGRILAEENNLTI
jgi:Protein of unknown function (DUF2975)